MSRLISVVVIGNCQAEALAWYIRRLPQNKILAKKSLFSCNWIVAERFKEHLKKIYKKDFKKYQFLHADAKSRHNLVVKDSGEIAFNIFEKERAIKKIQNADIIIFQKIQKGTSALFNHENVKIMAKDDAKLISISNFFYSKKDKKYLEGMKEREDKLRVLLKASYLIKKNPNINSHIRPEHPNVFYFLELVKEICKILDWTYYTENQVKAFLNLKFPFGQNGQK